MGISAEMERSLVALLVLAALCACAVMAETQEEVQQLQDSKYDPAVDAKHMNEVNKIRDFKSMTQYIAGRVKEVQKAELAKKFNGENEEIAIGNTLKSMEAKHAHQLRTLSTATQSPARAKPMPGVQRAGS